MTTEPTFPAVPPTDRQFTLALSEYRQARDAFLRARSAVEAAQTEQAAAISALPPEMQADMTELEVIADRLKIHELGDVAFRTMSAADRSLTTLVNIPAGTHFELFEKMRAVYSTTWDVGDHSDRLLADAGRIALQFGEVWLKRWTEKGGSVTRDTEDADRVWIGRPAYRFSPDHELAEERMSAGGVNEEHKPLQREWGGAFYDGQMRELSDFLDAMPGGLAAVKAIVLSDPARGLSDAARKAVTA